MGGGQGEAEEMDSIEANCGDVDDAEADDDGCTDPTAEADQEEQEDSSEQAHPLLFFYDCEATGFSIYEEHITR